MESPKGIGEVFAGDAPRAPKSFEDIIGHMEEFEYKEVGLDDLMKQLSKFNFDRKIHDNIIFEESETFAELREHFEKESSAGIKDNEAPAIKITDPVSCKYNDGDQERDILFLSVRLNEEYGETFMFVLDADSGDEVMYLNFGLSQFRESPIMTAAIRKSKKYKDSYKELGKKTYAAFLNHLDKKAEGGERFTHQARRSHNREMSFSAWDKVFLPMLEERDYIEKDLAEGEWEPDVVHEKEYGA